MLITLPFEFIPFCWIDLLFVDHDSIFGNVSISELPRHPSYSKPALTKHLWIDSPFCHFRLNVIDLIHMV